MWYVVYDIRGELLYFWVVNSGVFYNLEWWFMFCYFYYIVVELNDMVFMKVFGRIIIIW